MAVPVTDVQLQGPIQSGTILKSLSEAFRFDAVISRGHSRSSQITDSPLEDGSTVADHIILAPATLQLEALVSDHPLDKAEREASYTNILTRSESAAAFLEQLWREKTLLTVTTRLHVYRDMVIERLDWQESAEIGEALAVSMTLREVRKVSLVSVPIEKLATATADLAASTTKRGRQHARPRKGTQAMVDALQRAGVVAEGKWEGFAEFVNPSGTRVEEIPTSQWDQIRNIRW